MIFNFAKPPKKERVGGKEKSREFELSSQFRLVQYSKPVLRRVRTQESEKIFRREPRYLFELAIALGNSICTTGIFPGVHSERGGKPPIPVSRISRAISTFINEQARL